MDTTQNAGSMMIVMSPRKNTIILLGRSLSVLALLLPAEAVLPFSSVDQAVQLEISSEYSRPDPFGNIVEADRGKDGKSGATDAKVGPEFTPALTGLGRGKHITISV